VTAKKKASGSARLDARTDMAIVHRPIAELVPYARNARTHSAAQVKQIGKAMKRFGWTNPVLIDEHGGLIAGHGRILAAESLGLTDAIPTITIAGLSDDEKKALVLADNRIALNAGWDNDMLLMELGDIIESGIELDEMGFNQAELDALLGDKNTDLMDPTDGEGQTQGESQAMLSWGKTKVPLTAEEIAMLERAYADHTAIQGVSYGFVRTLMGKR